VAGAVRVPLGPPHAPPGTTTFAAPAGNGEREGAGVREGEGESKAEQKYASHDATAGGALSLLHVDAKLSHQQAYKLS
jgi:hypothetical protein